MEYDFTDNCGQKLSTIQNLPTFGRHALFHQQKNTRNRHQVADSLLVGLGHLPTGICPAGCGRAMGRVAAAFRGPAGFLASGHDPYVARQRGL